MNYSFLPYPNEYNYEQTVKYTHLGMIDTLIGGA